MHRISRRTLVGAAGGLALAASVRSAAAQEAFESLRIIVGFPAGGTSDLTARWIGDKLPKSYARSTLVDNRPGAAGRIAVDLLKAAPPDGRTMLLTPYSVVAVYPHVYKQLSYDPMIDLLPVSGASDFVHGLGISQLVPAEVKDLAGLAAWARANPTQANVGNPGEGSLPHFLTIMMAQGLDAPIQAVPYRGGAPAMVDLLGGRLAGLLLPEGAFLQQVAEGRLRMLATSGPKRSQFSPGVATFTEQGLPKVLCTEWFGLFMPGRTPMPIAERAASAVREALADKDLAAIFAKSGMVPGPTTPQELAQRVKSETAFWGEAVRGTGFKPIE